VDISEEIHAQTQARVLATAAEAIRIITASVHPILPESTAKVWRQLGLGDIEEAAKRGELKESGMGRIAGWHQLRRARAALSRAQKRMRLSVWKISKTKTTQAL
jgi:methionyl-tRNA synthetase